MALIVPGLTPQKFPDSLVFALPGLFRDDEEASLVFTRLIEDRTLERYSRFVVIGAHVSVAENIHSRKPIATISDLKGQSLRLNNSVEADALRRLGASPVQLPLNRRRSPGSMCPSRLQPSRPEPLPAGTAPLALVMNRDAFAGLPPRAQDIIRKYSGDWPARQKAACAGAKARDVIAQLRASPLRKVVDLTPADLATARAAFDAEVQNWLAASAHNRELMDKVMAALAALRKEQTK